MHTLDRSQDGVRLACAVCGRQLHDHAGTPPDCVGFVRPVLPAGYAYASDLGAGTAFRFLGRGERRTHVSRRDASRLDDENGLVELCTEAGPGTPTAYLVEGTTVVRLDSA